VKIRLGAQQCCRRLCCSSMRGCTMQCGHSQGQIHDMLELCCVGDLVEDQFRRTSIRDLPPKGPEKRIRRACYSGDYILPLLQFQWIPGSSLLTTAFRTSMFRQNDDMGGKSRCYNTVKQVDAHHGEQPDQPSDLSTNVLQSSSTETGAEHPRQDITTADELV
jgi:hypothetical protein